MSEKGVSTLEETYRQAWGFFDETKERLTEAQVKVKEASDTLAEATQAEMQAFEVARMALKMSREAYWAWQGEVKPVELAWEQRQTGGAGKGGGR